MVSISRVKNRLSVSIHITETIPWMRSPYRALGVLAFIYIDRARKYRTKPGRVQSASWLCSALMASPCALVHRHQPFFMKNNLTKSGLQHANTKRIRIVSDQGLGAHNLLDCFFWPICAAVGNLLSWDYSSCCCHARTRFLSKASTARAFHHWRAMFALEYMRPYNGQGWMRFMI